MTHSRNPSSVASTVVVVDDVSVLSLEGVLDSTTYLSVRNTIIKAGLDHPRAVVVDITDLTVPAESALAVFTSARWHIGRWPDVPLLMVCRHQAGRDALFRNGVARYAPVYDDVDSAIADLATGAAMGRRRARLELPDAQTSFAVARQFTADCLDSWSQPHLFAEVMIVVNALLENVFEHTTGVAGLRLESNGESVTVAVDDTSAALAGAHETMAGEGISSLQIVAAVSSMWGNSPTPTGKTVWAVIGPEDRL